MRGLAGSAEAPDAGKQAADAPALALDDLMLTSGCENSTVGDHGMQKVMWRGTAKQTEEG